MKGAIPVVFCFDANFVNYAAVATFSAFTNSNILLKFYWVVPSQDVNQIATTKELLEKRGAEINIKPVSDHHFSKWKEAGQVKKAAYIRLLIPDIIPEQKAIYLDCDVIVNSDLETLFNTNLNKNPVGGTYDLYGDENSAMPRSDGDRYINSGVLVLDLKKLREEDFFQKCVEIYNTHSEQITFCDQCIINKYAENRKTLIEAHWNFYAHYMTMRTSKSGKTPELGMVRIFHFLGPIKPWDAQCPACVADTWWKYADLLSLPSLRRESRGPFVRIKRSFTNRVYQSIERRAKKIKDWACGLIGICKN